MQQDLLDEPRLVPMSSGNVNYMLFLTRYQAPGFEVQKSFIGIMLMSVLVWQG